LSAGDDVSAPLQRFGDWLVAASTLEATHLREGVSKLCARTILEGVTLDIVLGATKESINEVAKDWLLARCL